MQEATFSFHLENPSSILGLGNSGSVLQVARHNLRFEHEKENKTENLIDVL